MPSYLIAGDSSNGVQVTSSNDNTLTIQTGAAGAKVNAIALASDGGATFIKTTGGILTLGTAQNTTSGTSIDFTSIPSWVKRIQVFYNGVSYNANAIPMVQIGAGSITSTGYNSAAGDYVPTANHASATNGFIQSGATGGLASSAGNIYGIATLVNIGGNVWVFSSVLSSTGTAATATGSGSISLGGTLDRVRITSQAGTSTFDAGSVNILYEG